MLTPKEIAEAAVRTLDAKQAKEIKLLHTTELTVLADYFVICTATCGARATAAAAGYCWTSAASSCTSSSRTCASSTISSTCGATRRR